MKNVFFLLVVLLIYACSNKPKSDSGDKNTKKKHTLTSQQNTTDSVVYHFTYNGKTYDYVYLSSDNMKKTGISDTKGNVIIPLKYDYVVYPGQTYYGYVEVCRNKKFGLYSFPEGKEIFPTEYDAFYPVYDKNIKFYYKKDGKYGYIAKGNYKNSAYEHSPFENKTAANWNFETNEYNILSYTEEPCCQSFCVFPSFFTIDNSILSDDWVETGPSSANIKYIGSTANKNYFYEISLNVDYYKMFFAINKNFNKTFKVGSPLLLRLALNDYFKYLTLKIINDTLFRIKDYMDSEYVYVYNYYKIDDTGYKKIKTYRKFPFTKYEKLDSSYFYGYFIKGDTVTDLGAPAYIVSYHLSMEDLDIMKNEIFAYYGYKFKTEKWKNYFSKTHWYKPLYNNIDDKLSALEKYNIQVILKEQDKIKKNKKKYLHTDILEYLSFN